MPRFFFHVRSTEDFIRDEEGIELPDLDHAKSEAREGAKGILKQAIDENQLIDGQKFEVMDEAGNILFVFAFRDAISL